MVIDKFRFNLVNLFIRTSGPGINQSMVVDNCSSVLKVSLGTDQLDQQLPVEKGVKIPQAILLTMDPDGFGEPF